MSDSARPAGETVGAILARATALLAPLAQGPVKACPEERRVHISSLRAQRSNLSHGATVRLLRRSTPRNDSQNDFDRALPVANDEARLEAEVLLRHVLGLTRAQLYAQLDHPLLADQAAAYNDLLARRLAHEPVAYLTGHREFFGLDFLVNRHVLIPRPETELLVELGLNEARRLAHLAPASLTIADVGTGCGCVAVSLAVHLPAARVYALDASTPALAVAAENCQRHGVAGRVRLLQGDLLAPLPELVHIIVANLPYIPSAELATLPPEIRLHEPRAALDGGEDGLAAIRRLLAQAPAHLLPGGAVLLEIGHGQGQSVGVLARQHFPAAAIAVHRDGAGRERVVVVRQVASTQVGK